MCTFLLPFFKNWFSILVLTNHCSWWGFSNLEIIYHINLNILQISWILPFHQPQLLDLLWSHILCFYNLRKKPDLVTLKISLSSRFYPVANILSHIWQFLVSLQKCGQRCNKRKTKKKTLFSACLLDHNLPLLFLLNQKVPLYLENNQFWKKVPSHYYFQNNEMYRRRNYNLLRKLQNYFWHYLL